MADPSDPVLSLSGASAAFRLEGARLTVSVWGELDLSSASAVGDAISRRLEPEVAQIRVDLRDLALCDSSGLGMLFRLRQGAADAGVSFALANPAGPVRRTIEMCDPSGVLPIVDDVADRATSVD